MTPAFKHRLLGTVILVLAGVIFLPDLLDGEKQVVKDDFKVIPSRPEFEGVPQQQVFDEQQVAAVRTENQPVTVDEQPLDATDVTNNDTLPEVKVATVTVESTAQTTTQTKTPARPASNTALTDVAWVVRVGSFSKVQNANALVAKLRQAGFTTFTHGVTSSQGVQLTSVLVGPELKKERLEQQIPKLQQLTGIERLTLVSYTPTENN